MTVAGAGLTRLGPFLRTRPHVAAKMPESASVTPHKVTTVDIPGSLDCETWA
jgi:hypothetical protein